MASVAVVFADVVVCVVVAAVILVVGVCIVVGCVVVFVSGFCFVGVTNFVALWTHSVVVVFVANASLFSG